MLQGVNICWIILIFSLADFILHSPIFVCSFEGLEQGAAVGVLMCHVCSGMHSWQSSRASDGQVLGLVFAMLSIWSIPVIHCSMLFPCMSPALLATRFLFSSQIQCMTFLILQHVYLQLLLYLCEAIATLCYLLLVCKTAGVMLDCEMISAFLQSRSVTCHLFPRLFHTLDERIFNIVRVCSFVWNTSQILMDNIY